MGQVYIFKTHSYWILTKGKTGPRVASKERVLAIPTTWVTFFFHPPTPGCWKCNLQMSSSNILSELNTSPSHWGHPRPAESEAACEQDPREAVHTFEKHWLKAPHTLPLSTVILGPWAPLSLLYARYGCKQGSSSHKCRPWGVGHRRHLKWTSVRTPPAPALAESTGTPTCNYRSSTRWQCFAMKLWLVNISGIDYEIRDKCFSDVINKNL